MDQAHWEVSKAHSRVIKTDVAWVWWGPLAKELANSETVQEEKNRRMEGTRRSSRGGWVGKLVGCFSIQTDFN